MRFSTNIFFFFYLQHITMSHKSDSSLKGKADNSSFVLQAMQQQFERLNFVLGEVRDRMDHQEAAIRNLQGGRNRRRRERRVENEYENEDDSDGMPELVDASDDDGVVYPVTSESLIARRALNTQIKVDEEEQQRENIFHTGCHVNNKVYSMIIDGRSCTNVASTTLIEKLNLPTLKHSRLYKLQWLNDCGEVRVDRQVLVTFSIGKYLDEVLCDVVPMHAGHILLGRS